VTGAELRALRNALGLSQRALGKELGVQQATVWRWESEAMPIERPRMMRLALEALAARKPPPAPSEKTKNPAPTKGGRARARDTDSAPV